MLAKQRISQMADIRALELQNARSRKHAARGDRTASVRLDDAQHDALLRPLAPEALRPAAGAGEAASLVQLATSLQEAPSRTLGRSAGDAGSLNELDADAGSASSHGAANAAG
eukprot:12431473-Alexandrium_andersonii.AAC.1